MRRNGLIVMLFATVLASGCQRQKLFTRSELDERGADTYAADVDKASSIKRTGFSEDSVGEVSRDPRGSSHQSVGSLIREAHELVRDAGGTDSVKLRKAKALLAEALHKRPGDATIHHQLGIVNDLTSNYREAELHYQRGLDLKPGDAGLLCDAGYSYFLQGKFQQSERYLKRALDIRPDHKLAAVNLGAVYGALGNRDEALAWFRRAGSEQEAQANLAEFFSDSQEDENSDVSSPFPDALREDAEPLISDASGLTEAPAPSEAKIGSDDAENPFEDMANAPSAEELVATADEETTGEETANETAADEVVADDTSDGSAEVAAVEAEPNFDTAGKAVDEGEPGRPAPYPFSVSRRNDVATGNSENPFLSARTQDGGATTSDLGHLPTLPEDSSAMNRSFANSTSAATAPSSDQTPVNNSLPMWGHAPGSPTIAGSPQPRSPSTSESPTDARPVPASTRNAQIAGMNAGPGAMFPLPNTANMVPAAPASYSQSVPPAAKAAQTGTTPSAPLWGTQPSEPTNPDAWGQLLPNRDSQTPARQIEQTFDQARQAAQAQSQNFRKQVNEKLQQSVKEGARGVTNALPNIVPTRRGE